MSDIAPLTVGSLPGYGGFDGENADNYFRAGQRKAILYSEVISPFSDALKDFTEYDDDNIPSSETTAPCQIGEMEFVMKVTPTTKRPGYKEVFQEVDGHLRSRLAQYNADERPVGIMTIDGEPYVSANDVLKMIKKNKRAVSSKGVKIAISDQPDFPSDVSSVVVPLGMDLGELNAGNASRYLEANSLVAGYASLMQAFEAELLGMTGYDNGHVPDKTEHMYKQVGRHIFHVKSIPVESTKYEKAISGLDAKPGRRKVENGGDLTLVTSDVSIPRLDIYQAKVRDGDHLVRLRGLIRRMDNLIKKNTDTKVKQKPIIHYPAIDL
jgi:hypothetical protein